MTAERIIHPYIDIGDIALPIHESLAVFDGVKDVLSPYIEGISYSELRGIKSPPDALEINPFNLLNIMKHSHVAVLTKRTIAVNPEINIKTLVKNKLSGICYFKNPEQRLESSVVIVSTPCLRTERDIDESIATLAHEIGHSYGLEHCLGRTCLMSQSLPLGERHLYATKQSGLFCNDHLSAIKSL